MQEKIRERQTRCHFKSNVDVSDTESPSEKDCLRERRDFKSVKKLSTRLDKVSHSTFTSTISLAEPDFPCYELKNTWKVPAIQKLYA